MDDPSLDPAISFRPATGQRALLRSLASARGCTVADVIREAVQVLAGLSEHDAMSLQYRANAQAVPVADLLGRIVHRALATEERLAKEDRLEAIAVPAAHLEDDDLDALASRLGGGL